MKFKAGMRVEGLEILEGRFMAAVERVGGSGMKQNNSGGWQLYLTRDHVMFLHNLLGGGGDGVQCVAQFSVSLLFHDYHISSRNADRIAFSVEPSLLHRALRSSLSILAHSSSSLSPFLQMKLVKKLPAGSSRPAPFLSFETKGQKSAVIQDVPISRPLSAADVSDLHSALLSTQELPETLVQVPDLQQLQGLVDRLRHVGDVLSVSITRYGDLHLKLSSSSLVTLGFEFRGLRILGVQASPLPNAMSLSPQARMELAIQRGEAMSVQVSMKHLLKSIQCHLAKPDCTFFGIAPQGACLMVIFQFFIPGTRQTDKSISLHCRIPVLDSGSN
ncbi:hypothetical protein QJS10_CPA01g02274 [Acorus calamus]|uniref:Checkpoint protein n=1 Tax=Acorus calamus TaxID=4465 RepID=A0AAV9FGU8_ACOCL|nr:hypothetical protein QJS10_CPA01g02274 [Acorus calamus]